MTTYSGPVYSLSEDDTYEGLHRKAAEARARQREVRRDPKAIAAAKRKRVIAWCERIVLALIVAALLFAAAHPGWLNKPAHPTTTKEVAR